MTSATWPRSVLFATCSLLFSTRSAQASPLLDLTGETNGIGGLQARTVPSGSGAAYFNPALLIDVDPGVNVGFMILVQQIGLTLAGRPGTEFAVPPGIENATHSTGDRFDNYPIPTNLLQNGRPSTAPRGALAPRPRQGAGSGHQTTSYEVVGLVVKLLDQRVALGFHGAVPNGTFTSLRAFYNDEREQYFSNSLHPELYSDRMKSLSFAGAIGLQLSETLSIGIGATLSLAANVGAPTYIVDTGSLDKILIDIDGHVNMSLSPHFGARYKLGQRLRLSASAHAPERVQLDMGFTFLLANGIEQQSGTALTHDYTPWQFGLGAIFDLVSEPSETLSVAGTLQYARWSDYQDRHGATPSGEYTWANTLSPALGVRYRWQDLSTFVDVAYAPTPVPPQTGRTNYVDNDRVSGDAGAEYRFRLWNTAMRLGAQLQLHWLVSRAQTKLPTPATADGSSPGSDLVKDELPDDSQIGGKMVAGSSGLQTNNPGWPGFESRGWIIGSTVYIGISL